MLVLLFLVACQTVPITGRRTLSLLPESNELRMGLSAYQDILKKVSTHPSPDTRIKQIEGWLPEALTHYRPR